MIVGVLVWLDWMCDIDCVLDLVGIDLIYDGLGVRLCFVIVIMDLCVGFMVGEMVGFCVLLNYFVWIVKVQVVIMDVDGEMVVFVLIQFNGMVVWMMFVDGDGIYCYFLWVSDVVGCWDEICSLFLMWVVVVIVLDLIGLVIVVVEGDDMLVWCGILVLGGVIIVLGYDVQGQFVYVLGELVVVDLLGSFVVQCILFFGIYVVSVVIGLCWLECEVMVQFLEWFVIGIVDLMVGCDQGESWMLGWLVGFVQGILVDGMWVIVLIDM